MIFDISDEQFLDIMQNESYDLPMRWDGRDFEDTLSVLLDKYESELSSLQEMDHEEDIGQYMLCDYLRTQHPYSYFLSATRYIPQAQRNSQAKKDLSQKQ